MKTKEEILLAKMQKVRPMYAKLKNIFAEDDLRLILEAMDEYYNQALLEKLKK